MKLQVAWIQAKPGRDKLPGITDLTREYMERLKRYSPVESRELASEEALFSITGRTQPYIVLLDPRGKEFSSEQWAGLLRGHQQRGTRQLVFAVGGANGFADESRRSAGLLISLGKITLPHELARVVLLEQLYRAFTILTGHPYHTGH